MESKKLSPIIRECKKDDEYVKTILPQKNGYIEEYRIEQVVVKLEDYNEMYENKEYVTQIKEEVEIPELKYSEININVNKEKVEPTEYEEVKKEEVATKNKNYTPVCRTCNEKFAKDEELNEHYRHNESHKPKRYMCIHCRKSFDYLTELCSHKKEEHTEPNYKKNETYTSTCDLCERGFLYPSALKIHMVTHTMEKHFLCEYCGKLFSSHRTLIPHRYLVHELKKGEIPKKYIAKKDFNCNICKKIYRTRTGLKMHILMHKKEYNFLCNFCGRKYLLKCSLEAHIRSHAGNKPHSCPLCGKYFSAESSLKNHNCVRINKSKSAKGEDYFLFLP